MSLQVTVTGPFDPALYIRASSLHYRSRLFGKGELTYQAASALAMCFLVFGVGGAGVVTVILLYGLDAVNTLLIFLMAVPVAWAIWSFYHRSMWRTMYLRILASPLYNRAMTYSFDAAGFEMSSDGASWQITWPVVDNVITDKGSLFLLVGGIIYIVPATAMNDETYTELSAKIDAWRQP
ncbi:MAG: YcxB family protein [Pseudomonadota bacterium]